MPKSLQIICGMYANEIVQWNMEALWSKLVFHVAKHF